MPLTNAPSRRTFAAVAGVSETGSAVNLGGRVVSIPSDRNTETLISKAGFIAFIYEDLGVEVQLLALARAVAGSAGRGEVGAGLCGA